MVDVDVLGEVWADIVIVDEEEVAEPSLVVREADDFDDDEELDPVTGEMGDEDMLVPELVALAEVWGGVVLDDVAVVLCTLPGTAGLLGVVRLVGSTEVVGREAEAVADLLLVYRSSPQSQGSVPICTCAVNS